MELVALLAAVERVVPIIVFLLSVTLVAELSDRIGVFDVVGHWIARRGRHRLRLLWLLFAAFAVSCTVFLSLDTTAVLLTPVALAIAGQIDVPPRPFALTTLWIANTGSLLLPVSNLTNLLALDRFARLGLGHLDYIKLAFLPGLASITVTRLVIFGLHKGMARTRYVIDPPASPHDERLLRIGMAVCLLVGPAFAVGLPPWAVSLLAAGILLAATGWRAPQMLRSLSVPWVMAAGFALLTIGVAWVHDTGGLQWLTRLVGSGTEIGDLARVAVTAAGASNVVNNLPAYLAIEPTVTDHPLRLFSALIGANAGPLITPWASLATLLWLQRCRAAGVTWRLGRLALAGALCATLACGAAVVTLALVS